MSSFLPWFFVVLATILLATALLTLWQSLRAAFGLSDLGEVESEGDEDERRALLAEKDSLVENLRDLAFDHEAKKLSDDDFHELDGRLRAKARDVLRRLDADVASQRTKAESLVAERFAKEGLAYASTSATTEPSSSATTSPKSTTASESPVPVVAAAEPAPVPCAACGTKNDADAAFCKKCGAKLAAVEDGE